MATITTDTFLDGGVARTTGETWTISNGANFIIRTDSRWHANAPASMTGSIGNINITTAGGVRIDGTKVRWMEFNSGTGTVPAIGTTVTQGGVSGHFLGVWSSLTVAPTAVGAAMPSTGFIKFREVTGGTFAAGALTGISASAVSPDVTGWIEVVFSSNATLGGAFGGDGYVFTGEWFYLGTTNGSRGQTFQVPTNNGGANTYCLGVEIEDAPGSNTFTWYPGIDTTTGWSTAFVSTDARSKYVGAAGGGQIVIGQLPSPSTDPIGHLPVSGCRVRTPNIFLRQCTAGSAATTILPSTSMSSRPTFNTSGAVFIDKVSCDYRPFSTTMPKTLTISNSVFETYLQLTGAIGAVLSNIAVGSVINPASNTVYMTGCIGLNMNGAHIVRRAVGTCITLFYGSDNIVNNVVTAALTTSHNTIFVLQGEANTTVTNVQTRGGGFTVTSCDSPTIIGHDYCDRLFGDTNNAGTQNCLVFSNNKNLRYENLTFGVFGTVPNCHPYGHIFSSGGGNVNVKIRNAGTFSSRLPTGAGSSLYPAAIFRTTSSNADLNVRVQRIYPENIRVGLFNPSVSYIGESTFLFEHVMSSGAFNFTSSGATPKDMLAKGVRAQVTSVNAVGTFFIDSFTSDTIGALSFLASPLTPWSSQYVTVSVNTSNKFAGVQGPADKKVVLPTVGDFVIFESPYWILGHTALRNVAPTITSTGGANLRNEFQVDAGAGWGEWKLLTAANLAATPINDAGFKIRVMTTCLTANNTNEIRFFSIATDSTANAQANNLYPLDQVTLSFENLQPGSEVRAYVGTDPATAVEIGGIESVPGTTWSFTHSSAGQVGYIAVFALGFNPLFIPRTYASSDSTLLISQVIDRTYHNPD